MTPLEAGGAPAPGAAGTRGQCPDGAQQRLLSMEELESCSIGSTQLWSESSTAGALQPGSGGACRRLASSCQLCLASPSAAELCQPLHPQPSPPDHSPHVSVP